MTDALYRTSDWHTFEPTRFTMGPWRADAQHGGPPSALLCLLAEQHLQPEESILRCHVELRAAVPLTPLTAEVDRVRISSRVAQITTSLTSDRIVARATSTILRGGDIDPPEWVSNELPPKLPGPDEATTAPAWASGDVGQPFHRDALEHRFVSGGFLIPGPARDWIRLKFPVVAQTPVTAAQRVMASADIGSGISAVFGADSRFGMINADLDVTFVRRSDSDWFMLDAATHLGSDGTGVAQTSIWDADGRVAHATQTLLGYRF